MNHSEAQELGNCPCAPETKEKPPQGAGLRPEPPGSGSGDWQRGGSAPGGTWGLRGVNAAGWGRRVLLSAGGGAWGLQAAPSVGRNWKRGLWVFLFICFCF